MRKFSGYEGSLAKRAATLPKTAWCMLGWSGRGERAVIAQAVTVAVDPLRGRWKARARQPDSTLDRAIDTHSPNREVPLGD
jgi:hypothetical protein